MGFMDKLARWIAVLLKAARTIYVLSATACILVVAVGALIALYFQLVMIKGPEHVAIPAAPIASAPTVSPDVVDDRLRPPANVRVTITRALIDEALRPQDVIGYFNAETVNGFARFPEDVDVLGGKDSSLFDRKQSSLLIPGQGAALIPTQGLLDQINSAILNGQDQQRQDFSLIVVARDLYGVPSQATTVNFSLTYGRRQTGPAAAAPSQPAHPQVASHPMTELERLARDIALLVDREGSQPYLSAYDRALREPVVCGSSSGDVNFVANYRRIFDHARTKLTKINLQAFYDGICDGWRQSAADQVRARAEAEIARNAAIAANQSAEYRYQFEAAAAWAARNLTLIVVGSALAAFLAICLVLAFLALESHSNAMRQTMALLTEARRNETQ
jgi:hypothetical protein